jgi:hypothetical protein
MVLGPPVCQRVTPSPVDHEQAGGVVGGEGDQVEHAVRGRGVDRAAVDGERRDEPGLAREGDEVDRTGGAVGVVLQAVVHVGREAADAECGGQAVDGERLDDDAGVVGVDEGEAVDRGRWWSAGCRRSAAGWCSGRPRR